MEKKMYGNIMSKCNAESVTVHSVPFVIGWLFCGDLIIPKVRCCFQKSAK